MLNVEHVKNLLVEILHPVSAGFKKQENFCVEMEISQEEPVVLANLS